MHNTDVNSPVRYEWVDTMRLLGMFAVYLGHLMDSGGKLFPFVYSYHVPLFFLVSGFFASSSFKISFTENLKKKFITIMIPYFGFSLLNMAMYLLIDNGGYRRFTEMLKQMLFGVRGDTFAFALWFLPCLFVMMIVFDLLYRVFKRFPAHMLMILGLSFVLHFVMANAVPVVERFIATWFFSIDSALYYLVFYALGAFAFPRIKDKKFSDLVHHGKFELIVVTAAAFVAAVIIYFNETAFDILRLPLEPRHFSDVFVSFAKAMVIIYVNFVLAHYLSRIALLPKMGQNTLIYCGTENIIKDTVKSLLTMTRMSLLLSTPYITVLYTGLLLVLSHFTIVPFLNAYFPLLAGKFKWTVQEKKTPDEPVSGWMKRLSSNTPG